MTERTLLTIGAFARLANVSTAALRYYDRVGLLTPALLDPDTGYRYYSLTQLPRINRIVALKDLDFSLHQIALLLAQDLAPEQVRRMFARQQLLTQRSIAAAQARLTRLAAWLRQFDQVGHVPTYDIRIKPTDGLLLASVRGRVPHLTAREPLERDLAAYLACQGIRHREAEVVLVHSHHEVHGGRLSIDVEVGVAVRTPLPTTERVQIRQLPSALVAWTVHVGNERPPHAAYVALLGWLAESGHQLIGAPRQIQPAHGQAIDPQHAVTEVQFPIRHLAA